MKNIPVRLTIKAVSLLMVLGLLPALACRLVGSRSTPPPANKGRVRAAAPRPRKPQCRTSAPSPPLRSLLPQYNKSVCAV